MCLRTEILNEWFNYFNKSAIQKCLMRSNIVGENTFCAELPFVYPNVGSYISGIFPGNF